MKQKIDYDSLIREKAEQHKVQYPGFRLDDFMEWIASKPASWKGSAIKKSALELNQQRQKQKRFQSLMDSQD